MDKQVGISRIENMSEEHRKLLVDRFAANTKKLEAEAAAKKAKSEMARAESELIKAGYFFEHPSCW